jgi:hypothetical protein
VRNTITDCRLAERTQIFLMISNRKKFGEQFGWLRAEKPAVVALQELKAVDREFPKAAIEKAGYGAVWRGQKTWNGVAILARGCEPIVTRCELPGDPDVGVPAPAGAPATSGGPWPAT